jgi:hypothetical protein
MFQQGSDYISRPITTHEQMRRLPHQGARHSTVGHGDASDGVFPLLHSWVLPSSWAILLWRSPSSLSSLWMASRCEWLSLSLCVCVNGGASRTLGLKILRVQGKGGRTDPRCGPGQPAWADQPRPIPARFGRPFAPVGPQVIMHFAPSMCIIWQCHPRVQDRGSLCMKSALLCFNPRGCSYVALQSSPPLEVISSSSWTRTRLLNCCFELVVNPSFMSMFSYINTTLPNACTKMNLLYN